MKFKNSETLEIELTNGQGTYKFPDNVNFKGKAIKALEVHRIASSTKSPLGKAICNETALKTGYVTMNASGRDVLKDQPVISMSAAHLDGKKFELDNIVFSMEKSVLHFSDSTTLVNGEVFVITFYWD